MWLWDSRTHQFITSKALEKCSSSFSNMLKTHQELFILGIEAPDRIFKDFTNHYYNCTPNQYGAHRGSIIKKINKEIQLVNSMVNEPAKMILHPGIAPFLGSLLNTPLKAFIFELGVLSHYIADIHQPLHTDGKDRFADEETVHKVMEADTRLHLDDFTINLKRRRRIYEPIEYFTKQIYEINNVYDVLIEHYYLRPGKVKADRWQNSFSIIEKCLNTAAWNTANIFLHFEDAVRFFKKQVHHTRILKKIQSGLNKKKNYKVVQYPSGTISIRTKK